ncbi:MAG: hypothetical protein KatS3mg009_2050 [Acidimicrobiia bacterium]|nr:MAG: hypothetical protein KatS3mg009_2050 [Acidimicrobiia bacterium]
MGHRGLRRRGRAEPRGFAEPGRGADDAGQLARRHEVVALVLHVVAQHQVPDAHARQQRRERLGVEHPLLGAPVERVEEVRRAGTAVGDQLAGHVRPVHEPRGDRVDGVAPAVGREVGARQFEHTGRVVPRVEVRGGLQPVGGDVLVALQVLPVPGAVDERGEVDEHEDRDETDGRAREERAAVAAERVVHRAGPHAEEHRHREHHQRHRARRAAQREPRGGRGGEGLEHGAERGRAGVGVRTDRDDHAREERQHEVRPVAPPHQRCGRQREARQRVPREEHDRPLRVVLRRLDPRTEPVLPVEEPVAEPPQHLVRRRGARDRLHRLGVAEDVEAVAALDRQPGDPPQRRRDGQHPRPERDPERAPPVDVARERPRVRDPQDRADPGEDERRRVDAAHHLHDQCEDRRVAPPAVAQRLPHQRDHPRQRRPREQQHRDARRVVERVRREHVGERGDHDAGAPQPEGAHQREDARRPPRTRWTRATGAARPSRARRAVRGPSRRGPSGTGSRSSGA